MNLKSTPIKRERDKQTKLQLNKAVNYVEKGSLLFRSSQNSVDGYSTDGSGLHYFLTSGSGLEAYTKEENSVRWYWWQYKVEERFIIINIPEYSQRHPLTVPYDCRQYFDVKTEGTTRVERMEHSNSHSLDNLFYSHVFDQIYKDDQLRSRFPNCIFGLSMPASGSMHEEVVLDTRRSMDSLENLVPLRFQSFAINRRKSRKKSTNSTTNSTLGRNNSTFGRKIDFEKMSTITVFLEFPLYWDYSFEKVSDDEEDKKNLFFEKLRDIKNKLNTFVTENRHLNLDFSEFQTCYYQLVKILMLVTNDRSDPELNQLYNKYEKLLHNEVKTINLWSFLTITNNHVDFISELWNEEIVEDFLDRLDHRIAQI